MVVHKTIGVFIADDHSLLLKRLDKSDKSYWKRNENQA